jgi:hypothetical protein
MTVFWFLVFDLRNFFLSKKILLRRDLTLLSLPGFPDAARRAAGAARGGQSLDASNVPVAMMSKFGADPVAELQEAPIPAEMMSAFGTSVKANLPGVSAWISQTLFFRFRPKLARISRPSEYSGNSGNI